MTARLLKAAEALLGDVRKRYPGENLRCPYMIELDEAANEFKLHPELESAVATIQSSVREREVKIAVLRILGDLL